jgi:hypothetical protein
MKTVTLTQEQLDLLLAAIDFYAEDQGEEQYYDASGECSLNVLALAAMRKKLAEPELSTREVPA